MAFEVVGKIANVETIATGREIREFRNLVRLYGLAHWRKRKGIARVRLAGGKFAWLSCTGMKRTESDAGN